MIYLKSTDSAFLAKNCDLKNLDQRSPVVLDSIRLIQNWSNDFLANPYDELGRIGDVCPYMRNSLKQDYLRYGCYTPETIELNGIIEMMLELRDIYLDTEPTQGSDSLFKAFVMIFPSQCAVKIGELIDQAHIELKPKFTSHGLMLGQFHENCHMPGVHNPGFMSLHSPIPLFVVRYMVVNDYLFLQDEPQYLDDYFRYCSERYPEQLKQANFFKNAKS